MKFPPNIVNIHVKHPPEASVQIHQVSRIDGPPGQKVKEAQPGQSQVSYQGLPVQKTQTVHSSYSHQQVIPHVYPVAAKTQLGRCFQETIGSQVSKLAQLVLVMWSRKSLISVEKTWQNEFFIEAIGKLTVESFIEMQPYPLIYILSVPAFTLLKEELYTLNEIL